MTAPDLSSGACYGHADPDLFFPDEHTSKHRMGRVAQDQAAAARSICAECPLTGTSGPCLAYALDTRSSGVWAGTSTADRSAMIRRPLRRAAAARRRNA